MERSVEERVIDVVVEELGVSAEEREKITRETRFIEDLGADSLDLAELVMEFEEEFSINILDDVSEKIKTVGQAVDQISKMPIDSDS